MYKQSTILMTHSHLLCIIYTKYMDINQIEYNINTALRTLITDITKCIENNRYQYYILNSVYIHAKFMGSNQY